MRRMLGALAVCIGAVPGCADEEGLATEEQAVLVGNLAARFDDTLRGGGVVAQGASMSGRGDSTVNASAAVTIAGIPAGATVHRALLYWQISGGADTTATINSVAV